MHFELSNFILECDYRTFGLNDLTFGAGTTSKIKQVISGRYYLPGDLGLVLQIDFHKLLEQSIIERQSGSWWKAMSMQQS